jgi:hypothetical protein
MSTSAVNPASQSLYQFLQSISGNAQAQAASAASATASTEAPAGQAVQGAGHHHHHGHGGGAGFKKIEQAVTDALQSANGSSDPNKTIEDAIAKVFQDNSTTSSTTSGAADTDGDTDGSSATQASPQNDAAARQAFFQTLKSYGVDPQQFRQDLLAAMKDAQGGQVNPSTAFQSFPPGVAVDTAA